MVCDLLTCHAREKTHLDDAGLTLVQDSKFLQRCVQRKNVNVVLLPEQLGESHALPSAASLLGTDLSRMVDEDASHCAGGSRKEFSPSSIWCTPIIDQPKKGLVNQCCGLQRMVATLETHELTGHGPKLTVEDRLQVGPSFLTRGAFSENAGDLVAGLVHRSRLLCSRLQRFWKSLASAVAEPREIPQRDRLREAKTPGELGRRASDSAVPDRAGSMSRRPI